MKHHLAILSPGWIELIFDSRKTIESSFSKVQSGSGWGCVQCGLPAEGAVAIVCDACIERYGSDTIENEIRFLMDGRERRIPVPPIEERVLHEHDIYRHLELGWFEGENCP